MDLPVDPDRAAGSLAESCGRLSGQAKRPALADALPDALCSSFVARLAVPARIDDHFPEDSIIPPVTAPRKPSGPVFDEAMLTNLETVDTQSYELALGW